MTSRILVGHVLDQLAALPDASVHCVITSPPYYQLRAYGTEPQIWGGDSGCDHDWVSTSGRVQKAAAPSTTAKQDGYADAFRNSTRYLDHNADAVDGESAFCTRCDAWRGELGQEPTLALFLAHLVQVFREVKRVLRDDGVCFVNMGDSYAGGGGFYPDAPSNRPDVAKARNAPSAQLSGARIKGKRSMDGLKPKDLMMVPARLALALVDAGWYLRSDIIWAKPNPMPESVTDRPTSAHEHIFLLTKSARYFYDAEAVREPLVKGAAGSTFTNGKTGINGLGRVSLKERDDDPSGRNLRNVWTITTRGFPDAHFATFPPEIPRRCILAGTSAHGCCAACGTPWRRVVERTVSRNWKECPKDEGRRAQGLQSDRSGLHSQYHTVDAQTTGWEPSCTCDADVIPCTVLDPFGGAGTVSLVAEQLGRDSILVELNETYATMARERIQGAAPLLTTVDLIAPVEGA